MQSLTEARQEARKESIMIAVYKGARCIALVTIEELYEMTGAQLQGTITEFVQVSLI